MLLPAEPNTPDAASHTANRVTVVDAVDAATEAVGDMAGICSRNQAICDTGAAVWSMFLRKAEYGAKLVYDFASEARVGSGSNADGDATIRNAVERGSSTLLPSRDTLTDDDLVPAWRGPRPTDT